MARTNGQCKDCFDTPLAIRDVLLKLVEEEIDISTAEQRLKVLNIKVIEDTARLDLGRARRTGVPEVIFAENKESKDVAALALEYAKENGYTLVTRVKEQDVDELEALHKSRAITRDKDILIEYNPRARTVLVKRKGFVFPKVGNPIGLLAAGTADIPVAEEARVTAEVMGCEVLKAYDVGIAGLHRLFAPLKKMLEENVSAIIAVAGMEGALPSVVSSLVDVPVIGVPTSVGYGIGGGGVAALLTMLQTCSPGLAVVNIDNGFGAGAFAALIAKKREGLSTDYGSGLNGLRM